jgi:hypothetical protein
VPGRGSDEAPGPVRRVGDVLARELGWDAARLSLELDRFEQEAAAEGIVVHAGEHAATAPPAAMP